MAADIIFERARVTPDKTAVVHNGTACSYAQLARWIGMTRQFLATQALPIDAVAVILSRDLLEAWVLLFALRSLGITTVAAEDLRQLPSMALRNIGCIVSAAADGRPDDDGPDPAPGWRRVCTPVGLRQQAMNATAPESAVEASASPGAHIMMTSGTTGGYKKVVRDAATEMLALPLHAEINAIDADSIVYVVNFPLWTAGGYRWPLITWNVGGTVVIHQNADRHRPLLDHRMSHVFVTPRVLGEIVSAARGASIRNDDTRLMVTGGALSTRLLELARRELTCRVYAVFASTEALTVSVTLVEQPDDLSWHRIHPAREVQAVDDRDHAPCKPGQPGLVRVRIIDGLTGYLDDPEGTREFFRDGYFYSGDLGVLDDGGRFKLLGRASDVINVYGDKIATEPIERALQDFLHVDGVCIVSVANARGDDEVHVLMESNRRVSAMELRKAVPAQLGILMRLPVHVQVVRKLPRNVMGKIERIKVRRMVSESATK